MAHELYEKVTMTAVLLNGKRFSYKATRHSLDAMAESIRNKFNINLYGILVEFERGEYQEAIWL